MYTRFNNFARQALNIIVLLGMVMLSFGAQGSTDARAQEVSAYSHTIVRASVNSAGTQADYSSSDPSISGDGRYVAFQSFASNLVANDTNGMHDIFVHDLQSGTTTRVSVDSSGVQGNDSSFGPSISADGRYVAFHSQATNLVAGDTNAAFDVFVHDRLTGDTTRVSVDSSGAQGNNHSMNPSISADGHYVAFSSNASNLIEGDTNSVDDIFIYEISTGITRRVSVNSSGIQANGGSYDPSMSADGGHVAFLSYANNLVSSPTNQHDIYVHDLQTGATTLASVSSSGGAQYDHSYDPAISADGRYVAFWSASTNLVAGDTNSTDDVFVRDMQTSSTVRVSVNSSGQQGNTIGSSVYPSISADGRYVAFQSGCSNLVDGDTNTYTDIFIHDVQTGETTRLSTDSNGLQGNNVSYSASISSSGLIVAFYSDANNLVIGDTNAALDIFVSSSAAPTHTLTVNRSGSGIVTSDPAGISCGSICSSFFEENTVVSLAAAGSPGSSFNGWTGDITSAANPLDVTMDADKSITANFILEEYSLTITSNNGAVARSPDQVTYHYGDVVHLTATADPSYTFAGWSGDVGGFANPMDVTIEADTTINALFIQNPRTLTITSDHGSVSRSPDQAVYQDGDIVQLTAIPAAGYVFDHWSDAATGTTNPTNVTINSDTIVTANYVLAEYTLTITSDHGTVIKSPDQTSYHYGDVVHLTATPAVDYTFSNWSGDVSSTSNPYDLTIQGDTGITVNYTLNDYTLTITKTGNGSGTVTSSPPGINCGVDCSETYTAGSDVTLTAAAAAPLSKFTGWSGGDCSGTDTCTVELHADTMVTADFTTYRVYLPLTFKPVPPPGPFGKDAPLDGQTDVDRNPNLWWEYSQGAISYEYCFDTVNNDVCDTAWISAGASTQLEVTGLQFGTTYFWQVRALNEGGATYANNGYWFNFTTRRLPKAGFWWDNSTGTYFFVTPDQTTVREFSIYVYISKCYDGWISRTIPAGDVAITDFSFAFSGSYYATGTFDTETSAHGTLGLDHFPLCGTTWSGGPYPWNAVWLDGSQPTLMTAQAQMMFDAYLKKPQMTPNEYKAVPSK